MQLLGMGSVLKMDVNNFPLRWPMYEGYKDGVEILL